jgi:hypothetical protein
VNWSTDSAGAASARTQEKVVTGLVVVGAKTWRRDGLEPKVPTLGRS